MTDARDDRDDAQDEPSDGLETDLQLARISRSLFQDDSQPARLGRFVVVDRIGSGAMGTVLRAYDPQLDRSVAIKILRTQAGEREPAARTRLEREARALAKLNHPNVVSVHEVGTTQGQMFVAMEMVDGGDLAAWLTDRPEPSGRFSEALELLFQAGRGLSAAHESGVVHRDFKPANVLIGSDGRVRVADFGLARVGASTELLESRDAQADESESASVTQTGAVVGTPAYMAPEQRDGRPADALADQYSFCVTAWEALFGVRPGLKGDLVVPPGASSQARSVAATLKRGLASDRTARFEDMATLVDTLARNPVQRRRRLAVGALGIVGVGAAFAGYSVERSSRCDEVVEPADAIWNVAKRKQLEQGFRSVEWAGAERSWERFSQDADAYVENWKTTVQTSCRAARVDRTLDRKTYEAQSACFGDRLARFAGVLDAYSEPTRDLVVSPFSLTRAVGPLEVCVDRPQPVSEGARPLMKELGRGLGVLRAGKTAEGADILEHVLSEAQTRGLPLVEVQARAAMGETLNRLEGPEHSIPMREEAYWMALEYGDDALAAQLASALAFSLASTRDLDAAERWLKPAAALAARAGLGPDEQSEIEGAKARVAYARGDLESAQTHFEESHRLAIAAWGPDHPQTIAPEQNLTQCLQLRGERDRAVALAEHSLQVRRDHFGDWHPDVGRAHSVMGVVLGKDPRSARAVEHFERAVEIFTETYGREHREVASNLTSLGQFNQLAGDETAAAASFKEALDIFEKVADPNATLALTARMNLGRALFASGQCEEMLPLIDKVLAALLDRSPNDPRVGIARWMLGACHLRLGQHSKARALLEAARPTFADWPTEEGNLLVVFARLHRKLGETQQALHAIGEALVRLDGADADSIDRAEAITVKAWLHLDQGDLDSALRDARESADLYQSSSLSPTLRVGGWGEAARVLVAVGAAGEAKAAALEAYALIEAPEVASKLVPVLTVDLYLALAEAEIAADADASKAWARKALAALEDADTSYDDDRQLARELADLP